MSEKHLVNADVSQGFILSPTFFFLYINELTDDFIGNITSTFVDDMVY